MGFRVFLDFHDFLSGTPGDENVGSVVVLFPVLVELENEGLFLPGVRMPGGEQNLEGSEFVLRFRVPRPTVPHIGDLTLHSRLGSAYRFAHSPQLINVSAIRGVA
jgi:hypothetical protein